MCKDVLLQNYLVKLKYYRVVRIIKTNSQLFHGNNQKTKAALYFWV